MHSSTKQLHALRTFRKFTSSEVYIILLFSWHLERSKLLDFWNIYITVELFYSNSSVKCVFSQVFVPSQKHLYSTVVPTAANWKLITIKTPSIGTLLYIQWTQDTVLQQRGRKEHRCPGLQSQYKERMQNTVFTHVMAKNCSLTHWLP